MRPTTPPYVFFAALLASLLGLLVQSLAAGEADDPGYPRWRGPYGSGAAADTGHALVSRWGEAAFCWASEAKNPLPYDYKGVSRPHRMIGNGGFGCPVVADGKVYVAYFEPSGPLASIYWGNVNEHSPEKVRRIAADECLTCLDAETGLTLWTARFPGVGLNFAGKMYAGHYVPCVADGRVTWVGSLGRLFCVDATTGERYWSTSTGPEADLDARYLAYCLDVGKIGGRGPSDPSFKKWKAAPDQPMRPEEEAGSRGYGWDSPTVVAEGVVALNTRGRALVGVDLASGELLWRHENYAIPTRPPLLWRHAGREYLLSVGGPGVGTVCLEPRSGELLWQEPGIHAARVTPALAGDLFIGTDGPKGGYVCCRLDQTGATRLWSLPAAFTPDWPSPLIHRGSVWMPNVKNRHLLSQWEAFAQRWPEAFDDAARASVTRQGNREACAVADLQTGAITAVFGRPKTEIASFVGMDDRVISTGNLFLMDADPHRARVLDVLPIQNIWAASPTVCGGKLYFRGVDALVNCWDLRRAEDRPAPPRAPADWANGYLVLDLPGVRCPSEDRRMIFHRDAIPITAGDDLRLHLRTRAGSIRQAWVTYPPDHVDPELAFVDKLTLEAGRLHGELRIAALADDYRIDLDVEVSGTRAQGTFATTDTGHPVAGTIGGSVIPAVTANGSARLRLRREWNGGMNPGHKTFLDFELRDGVGVEPRLYSKADNSKTWTPTFREFEVVLSEGTLRGRVTLDVVSHGHAKSGSYRLAWTTPVRNNRIGGDFRCWRDDVEVTPKQAVNRQIWGTLTPAADSLDRRNAVYQIELAEALPVGRDARTLRVFAEFRDGKLLHLASDAPRLCGAKHSVRFEELTLKDTGLQAVAAVMIRTDGYVPLSDQPCTYTIDLQAADDGTLDGRYSGVYGLRAARRGVVTGTIRSRPTR